MLVNAYFNSEGEMCPHCRFRGTLQKILKLLTLVSILTNFNSFAQFATVYTQKTFFPLLVNFN